LFSGNGVDDVRIYDRYDRRVGQAQDVRKPDAKGAKDGTSLPRRIVQIRLRFQMGKQLNSLGQVEMPTARVYIDTTVTGDSKDLN
jgi:hypothetical protein